MTFSLYCLIKNNNSNANLNYLSTRLEDYFSKTDGFVQKVEEDPFDSNQKNLLLSWGDWWIRVFYEAGADVKSDSVEIAKYVDGDEGAMISLLDRCVRVLFADDSDLSHTNHIIFMTEFLESVDDFAVFDLQQRKFIS